MKVRFYPWRRSREAIYQRNLAEGLARHGVEFFSEDSSSADWLSGRWIRESRDQVDILHFHWTDYHYVRLTHRHSMVELARFLGKLWLARRRGYKIVWTMHNFLPHERRYPLLHYLERLGMAHLAHAVIVHCARGRELLATRLFRHRRVFTILHGDYGVFLDRFPRREARDCLGFSQTGTVFVCFGNVRPYRRVPELLRAFQKVAGDDLTLVVVGRVQDESLEKEILATARSDSRIHLVLEWVSDALLATYLSSADIAVLPYARILTSGAAITALSFGLPVVAPKLGCLPEVLTDGTGVLYDPSTESLESALKRSLEADLVTMRQAALARAAELPWEKMVCETVQVYQDVVQAP
jgi:beta-1,4-mannosyltransferase